MLASNGVKLEVTKPALELLAEDGYDPEFGARPVKRNDPTDGAQPASQEDILAQKVDCEHPIIIDRDSDEPPFSRIESQVHKRLKKTRSQKDGPF